MSDVLFNADCVSGSHRWPLLRVDVGGESVVVWLSESWLPVTVHWVGRSVLCATDGCALCGSLPARGLYYAAVQLQGRTMMIELGAMASSYLEQHMKLLHGGMRAGHRVRLWRRGRKAPIHGEVVETLGGVEAVAVCDLAPKVMALYQLPGPGRGEKFVDWQLRLQTVVRRRNEGELVRLLREANPGINSR